MASYNDITSAWENTKVMILTAPDKHDRLLFYRDFKSKAHNPIIVRQIPVNGRWRNTEGLLSDQLAIQHGGILTTKERGNLKYLEFVDKGYSKSSGIYEDVMFRQEVC